MNFEVIRDKYFNRRLLAVTLLGFSSGLPLALSGSTLQAWFTDSGVDIVTIGFLSLVGQPYVYKFLWSPLLDRFSLPFADRRRGWIIISQCCLIAVLFLMAFQSPTSAPVVLGILAMMLAFASATQDISIDAYRADLLKPRERGLGAALSVGGYRIAMLVSGGLALLMADHWGWETTFIIMAMLIGVSLISTVLSPSINLNIKKPLSLRAAVVEPLREFISRPNALMILFFIVVYKMGDAFAGTLTTAFLLRGVEFTLTDVGVVTKSVGFAATLLGIFLGGLLLMKIGLYRSLLWFGVLQAVTNLGFLVMSLMAKSYSLMAVVIGLENLAGGMGTAAFVALLMGLCNHRFTATQFALFSALSAVGRVYVGPIAGIWVEQYGWSIFFTGTVAVAIPGLILLMLIKPSIMQADGNGG
jgi:PAT family beta-lactamase induction signal transducer AmpG